jgi:hypothetical protein
MDGGDEAVRAGRQRWAAVVVASAFAGALEALDTLAHEGRVSVSCVGFATAAVLLELAALTSAFDALSRRRLPSGSSLALTGAIAVAVAIAEAFAGWAIERTCGVEVIGSTHPWSASTVAELGVLNGIVGLGLWALFVIYPFAVRDANARARQAERLRTAAELVRLRAHMQPHFLRGKLQAIAALVAEDPREARTLIGALGDMLRESLEKNQEMPP